MIRFLKYIFFGLTLLLLFHFETMSIGPLKISHLWKGTLLLFLIFNLINTKNKQYLIFKPLLWLAAIQLFNMELFNNTFNAFFLFGTTLLLPLLGVFALKQSAIQLQKSLLFFSSFFIVCFIPYELGILTSQGQLYELTSYGVDQSGIIGPFQGAHAASTALAGSFLTILYFWLSKSFSRIYLSVLLILSLYFLIFTYVRTGMLMVVLGVIPMLIYFSKKASTRFSLILFGGMFSILISGWVLSNETMMDRITGKRGNRVETDSFEDLGSGRGQIYIYALDIFSEANILEKLMGIGQTEQLKRMNSKLGIGLIPHNGFLLLLLNNGLFGLILFLAFIRKCFKFIKKLKTPERVVVKGLLYAYLVMAFFQNYDLLYVYLILAISVAYSYKLRIESLQEFSNNKALS